MSGSVAPGARRGRPLAALAVRLAAGKAALDVPEAAAVGVIAAAIAVLLATGPAGAAVGPAHIAAAVIGLAGLLVGSVLLVRASRTYFLGLGGAVVCGFLGLLFATYAVLVLNMSSSLARPAFTAVYQAGVDRASVLLALAGLVAAALLAMSPWSPHRDWLQPALVGAAVVLPSLGLAMLPRTGFALPADVVQTVLGRDDPLLILALAAVALAIPVQVAGAVGWIYGWFAGAAGLPGFMVRLRESRPAARIRRWRHRAWPRRLAGAGLARPVAGWVRPLAGWGRLLAGRVRRLATPLTALAVLSLWLMLGISGRLPGLLGGRMSEWHTLRALPAAEWFIAAAAAIVAAGLFWLWHGLLEPGEAASLGYVLTSAFALIVAATLGICLLAVVSLLAISSEPPAAVLAITGLGAATALATAAVWSGAAGRGGPALAAVVGTACLAVLAACAAAWPGGRAAVAFSYPYGHPDLNFFVTFANSDFLTAFSLLSLSFLGLLGLGFYLRTLRSSGPSRDWRRGPEYGYLALPFPLFAWMLLGGALLVPSAVRRPLGDAFASLRLPDPAAVVLVASVPVLAASLIRLAVGRYGDADRRLVRATLLLAGLSFVPFAVPAALRSGGRVALAALVLQLLFTLAVLVRRHMPPEKRKRNVTWQLGLSAVSIPLLAYAAVSAGRGSVFLASGVIGDVGRSVGLGALSQSRLIWTLPLVVAFAAADRPSARPRDADGRQSAWRDFECDWLVGQLDGTPPGEALADSFGKHLQALAPAQRRAYALQLAGWLRARCRFPHQGEPGAQQVGGALDTADRALAGKASPGERQAALTVARSLCEGEDAAARAGRLPFRHWLGATLRYALDDGSGDPGILIEAVGLEVTAAAREFRASQDDYGEAYDRATWRYRRSVGRLIEELPGNFTLFRDTSVFGLAPSLVLDDPPRRQYGLVQDFRHPYAWLAAIFGGIVAALVLIALAATVFDALLNSFGICAHLECILH